jgi:hypothetical protein
MSTMIQTTITLSSSSAYGKSGDYVARINGRHSKFTFEREFLGKGDKRIDVPGLYEIRDIDKKGRKDDTFAVVFRYGEGLRKLWIGSDAAMAAAREIDEGADAGKVAARAGAVVWETEIERLRKLAPDATERTEREIMDLPKGTHPVSTVIEARERELAVLVGVKDERATIEAEIAALESQIAGLRAKLAAL